MLAAAASCALLLSGCGVGYLLQAARGQAELTRKRVPLEVATERSADAALRAQLDSLRAAREFAVQELGLPDNASYRSYADIGRPYVVWSVVATGEFSTTPRQWCFPVAGCVAYRGYFSERAARAFAAGLARNGDDVMVGGVPAYSTLGRFDDPILSSMLRYGVDDAIGTLFHELAHQVVYVQDDTPFNEAFAMTVEQAGLARWLARNGEAAAVTAARAAQRARQQRFVAAITGARADLAALYAQPLAPERMRVAKQARLATLTAQLREIEAGMGRRAGFSEWLERGLNNAHLASVANYWDCVAGFERVLAEEGGDLPRFYERVRGLARLAASERRARLCQSGPR